MREGEHSNRSEAQRQDSVLVVEYQKRKSGYQKPVCFGCENPGHLQQDCPNLKRTSHKAEASHVDTRDPEVKSESSKGAFCVGSPSSDVWLIDSGASSHMTNQKELLSDYIELETPKKVRLGDGQSVDAVGIGTYRCSLKLVNPRSL